MSLDEALRIPGAYAVALITADEPALTWWGRSPTDREAQAASQVGRAAADLVRLSSVNVLTDTLDDVLVTSAQAFHVLRLIPTPNGQDRVAHLMLRRAGANLAMARHDFRRLTSAYATETAPASAAGESPAVGEALTVVGGPAVGESYAEGAAPMADVAPAVEEASAVSTAPAAEVAPAVSIAPVTGITRAEAPAVEVAPVVEEASADVSRAEIGAHAAAETQAEARAVNGVPAVGVAHETAAVPDELMMQDASSGGEADNEVVIGRATEPALSTEPKGAAEARAAEAEEPAEPELFAGLETLVARGSSAGPEAVNGMPVADVEALPVFSRALEGEPEIFRDAVAEFTAASEPDLAPKVEPDLAPKAEPDLAPKVEPDLAPKVEPDLAAEVEPDLALKAEPDLALKAEPGLASKAGLDVAAEVEPGLAEESESGLATEVEPEMALKVEPDVAAEVEPDVAPEAGPGAAAQAGAESVAEDWSEVEAEAELSDFEEEPGAIAELEALDVPDFGDETHDGAGREPAVDAGEYEDDRGSGLDEASDPEQDSLVETEKPILPRRSPGTENLPAAAVTAKASPAAWLDLLGQPYFNDETVLERVLGSLKRL
ncbi:hypothetical protein GCM10010435_04660 [Winogradskya consettensis]|uniref:Uncharacterized protein n=1 Tax=Winogradskya consettensis TaxID=113560 RepID=A0A919W4R2_9ACTN|nr:hypothetical protein [Actinoplanes consettensis]GIM79663.1 hypothetical protein Aco04nite_66710 [Actinoplanes consettensis]